jgi:metal-responsive CopG/Arc/MetJ family transcriptional regulator
MRLKISITLSEELLGAVDNRAKQQERTRSDFIETAVRALVKRQTRNERNACDLEIINRHADFLNQEASDVLECSSRYATTKGE